MKNETCPNCGSTEIIPVLRLEHNGILEKTEDNLYVELVEPEPTPRPRFWIQKNQRAGLRLSMCGNCGYCEFYSLEYSLMLEAYKKGYRSKRRATRKVC